MKIIGIAGGSGSGKSTVSQAIAKSDPERFEVICIDDYHRLSTEPGLPMLHGMINWDHPDIIRWDKLLSDIAKLKAGRAVTIEVKGPDYAKTLTRTPRTIKPKPVLIVEGYLTLYDPRLYRQFDKSLYLELDYATRAKRRTKNKVIDMPEYPEKVWKPMHDKYIAPTKQNADIVLDISGMGVEEVCASIKKATRR